MSRRGGHQPRTALAVALVLACGLSGCRGNQELEPSQSGECYAVAALDADVLKLNGLDNNSTVAQARRALAALRGSVTALKAEARDIPAGDKAALTAAVAGVASAIDAAAGQTLGEAAFGVEASLQPLYLAVEQVHNNVDCG